MCFVGLKHNPSPFLFLKLGIDPGLTFFLITQNAIEINLDMTIFRKILRQCKFYTQKNILRYKVANS